MIVDPCAKIHCGAGRVCQAEGETASCVCIPDCPDQSDPRRKVCTNRNETWNSDCHVYRERCLCDTDDDRCKSAELKHIHINYYGECKEMPVNRSLKPLFSNLSLNEVKAFIWFFIEMHGRGNERLPTTNARMAFQRDERFGPK